jgi:predicted PurR-regulated permease PerM
LLLGFLAGTFALIPGLGPAIATGIAAFVAWPQGSVYLDISNLAFTIIFTGVFQVVKLFEGFWLTPRMMGHRLNLHPSLVLIAIIGTLFTSGALMALIIVPILGSLDLVIRYIHQKQTAVNPESQTSALVLVAEEGSDEHFIE